MIRIDTVAQDGTAVEGEFTTRFLTKTDRPLVLGFIGVCADRSADGEAQSTITGGNKFGLVQIRIDKGDWRTVREGAVIDPDGARDVWIRFEQVEGGYIEVWTDGQVSYAW